ncbi:hypothetical protein FGB62_123g021 [Gracilaria domingensis]|nr:hypothetical protein FGB62_123g021 [Gracilaria domingensis]
MFSSAYHERKVDEQPAENVRGKFRIQFHRGQKLKIRSVSELSDGFAECEIIDDESTDSLSVRLVRDPFILGLQEYSRDVTPKRAGLPCLEEDNECDSLVCGHASLRFSDSSDSRKKLKKKVAKVN